MARGHRDRAEQGVWVQIYGLTKAYAELFKKTPIERPPTLAIGLELQVREGGAAVEIGNLGAGDAIAVNLVIEATNVSLGIPSNPVEPPTGRVYIYRGC